MTALVVMMAVFAQTAPASKAAKFLGFSKSETVSAWQIEVRQPQDNGSEDSYTLFHLTDADSNASLAIFRGPSIRRNRPGASQQMLLQANPDFANAHPHSEWLRVRGQAGFWALPITMKNVVRLRADEDTHAAFSADKKGIRVVGEPGSALGFVPMTFLVDETPVTLGHFHVDGQPGRHINAHVRAYASRSAFHVAIVTDFAIAGTQTLAAGTTARLSEALGSTEIGAFNVMRAHLRVTEAKFNAGAPGMEGLYSELVGRHW